ncbi:MAG: NUDIX domain-containing protein [Planctomycetes bacterium]|nr:NUDIX domain-containing protein [Planctomycetota bacterium]
MSLHPIDLRRTPTHAGGLVHRTHDGAREYLVVTSSKNPAHWVLPKGHLDPGETAEETAVREVEEESGVRATLEAPLGETELALPHERQRIRWYVMLRVDERPASEGRQVAWLRASAAIARLSFEDARELVRASEARFAHKEREV